MNAFASTFETSYPDLSSPNLDLGIYSDLASVAPNTFVPFTDSPPLMIPSSAAVVPPV